MITISNIIPITYAGNPIMVKLTSPGGMRSDLMVVHGQVLYLTQSGIMIKGSTYSVDPEVLTAIRKSSINFGKKLAF